MMRDFESPGRSFAVARHGMAATSHPAALDMLRRDAAVAAAALQGVVEVGSTGIGGDCFVLFSRAGSPKLTRGSLRAARHTFLTDDAAPTIGSMQAQPLLADTLEMIGRHGPYAFYTGAVAEDMVACLQALGGLHTLADFAGAKGEYVTPITTEFRGRTVFECPPNGQGVTVLLILNILLSALRTRSRCARHATRIDPRCAIEDLSGFSEIEHRDTIYIKVVDKDRNAVSLINSYRPS